MNCAIHVSLIEKSKWHSHLFPLLRFLSCPTRQCVWGTLRGYRISSSPWWRLAPTPCRYTISTTSFKVPFMNIMKRVWFYEFMCLIQVISDFDMTLTRFAYNGKRCPTCHSKFTDNTAVISVYMDACKWMFWLNVDSWLCRFVCIFSLQIFSTTANLSTATAKNRYERGFGAHVRFQLAGIEPFIFSQH